MTIFIFLHGFTSMFELRISKPFHSHSQKLDLNRFRDAPVRGRWQEECSKMRPDVMLAFRCLRPGDDVPRERQHARTGSEVCVAGRPMFTSNCNLSSAIRKSIAPPLARKSGVSPTLAP